MNSSPGSFQEAGVIQAAYALNCPLMAYSLTGPHRGKVEEGYVSVDTPSVIVETVKKVRLSKALFESIH